MESNDLNTASGTAAAAYTPSGQLLARKCVIFDAMKAANIEKIVVEYSGSGDEGQIDAVELTRAPDADESDELEITDEDDHTVSLSDYVEAFVDDLISESPHSGYQDNDGGSGTVTFEHDGVTWEHGDYYTERDVTEYSIT